MDTSKKYLHPYNLMEVMGQAINHDGDVMLGTAEGDWVPVSSVTSMADTGEFTAIGMKDTLMAVQYMSYAEYDEMVDIAKAIATADALGANDDCGDCNLCAEPTQQYVGAEPAADNKAHNSHYTKVSGHPQPIETIRDSLTPEEFAGYLKGNSLKYLLRAGEKVGESVDKELDKGRVYSRWFAEWNTKRRITLL